MSMKIREWRTGAGEWLYIRRRELLFALLAFLIATLSFGLGYLADRRYNHAPIVIEECGRTP